MGAFADAARRLLIRKDAGASIKELAHATGWKPSTVASAISRARWHAFPPARDLWTDAMVNLLADLWYREGAAAIARQVSELAGREVTPDAVNAKARRLGLEKPRSSGNNSQWWVTRGANT